MYYIVVIIYILITYIYAEIPFKTATIIQSNMVLQRAPYKATLWGTAPANSKVYAELESKTYSGKADNNGNWKILLDPHAENDRAYIIKITNSVVPDIIELKNILFGDVYICSGQSNMELVIQETLNPEKTYEEAKTLRNMIRLFTLDHIFNDKGPSDDINNNIRENWTDISPEALGANITEDNYYFSGLCYYTGLKIFKETTIPIGLISASWGGTIVEVWTPKEVVNNCDDLTVRSDYPNNVNSALYNGMIHPFVKMTIRGVFWYQGEYNVGKHGNYIDKKGYSCSIVEMIKSWRSLFSSNGQTDPNFPFGFVQLAGYCSAYDHLCKGYMGIADLRWAQTADYGYAPNNVMNNTFMATAIDYPDPLKPEPKYGDLHPRNKEDLGYRLGNIALRVIYNKHTNSITGPLINGCIVDNKIIQLNIQSESLQSESIIKKDIFGFEVMDNSGKWYNSELVNVTDSSIVISYKGDISVISGVRYLWSDNPCCPDSYKGVPGFSCPQEGCSIYTDKSKLPLLPFKYNIINNKCVIPNHK